MRFFIIPFLFTSILFASHWTEYSSELTENSTYFYSDNKELVLLTSENINDYFPNLSWVQDNPIIYPPLVIEFISDETGYGLFAGRDINKGEIVTSYAGEFLYVKDVQNIKNHNSEYYLININHTDELSWLFIDCKNTGNASRFMQHLESQENDVMLLDSCELAYENIGWHYDGNFAFPIAIATKDIEKGDIIGFDYGEDFWLSAFIKNSKNKRLFSKKGKLIPKSKTIWPSTSIICAPYNEPELYWSLPTNLLLQRCLAATYINEDHIKIPSQYKIIVASAEEILQKMKKGLQVFTVNPVEIIAVIYCSFCNDAAETKPTCSRCKKAYYCNKTCQKNDWKSHKLECIEL